MEAMSAQLDRGRAFEGLDPRIRRSRLMLHEALASLMKVKEFDRISIQDIAEAATLNRGTFYDHYPDKFALLECMVGSRFAELLAIRDVQVEDCSGALRAIALGVCDYLAEAPWNGGKSHEASVQMAIVGVIRTMMLEGLHDAVLLQNISAEVLASAVAWAIYGAANAWIHNPERCSAEAMAAVIDGLVKPVFAAAMAEGEAPAVPGGRR